MLYMPFARTPRSKVVVHNPSYNAAISNSESYNSNQTPSRKQNDLLYEDDQLNLIPISSHHHHHYKNSLPEKGKFVRFNKNCKNSPNTATTYDKKITIEELTRCLAESNDWNGRSSNNHAHYNAASSLKSSSRRSLMEATFNKAPNHDCNIEGCKRISINVSGMMFQTSLGVLQRHPHTLLGNPLKRKRYFNAERDEYFFDRHRPTFEAIFNYYQYGGKLKRPPTVPDDIFLDEVEFYGIEQEVVDVYKRDEGYVIENIVLPENPTKRWIWMLFEFPETSTTAFMVAVLSVAFTIISIILFCVETLPVFSQSHCVAGAAPNFLDPFFIIETVCTFWFTLEVIVRSLTCPSFPFYLKDIKNYVDLAAIVPYYVTLTNVLISFSCDGAKNSASLGFLRVIRLIRVFKLTKHSSGLQVLALTFRASLEGLGLFLVALIVCILVFSSTIYYFEFGVENSQISSIPDAFWWAIITMCTVGYGDKVPKGPAGKLVGSVCAVAGVLTLAIPVPIITENFNKFYSHKTGRGRH